jgi:hypothetical protein
MTQTHTMDQERPITLREQELLDRGRHLAQKLAQRDQMVKDAKDEAKRAREEIEELDDEISEIAAQLRNGFENRKQGDLFIDQTLPKDEAAKKLIEIAARAAKHPFVAHAEKIDTCAREECGKQQGDDVHVPPPPAEAHTFVPDGKGEGKCWACESTKDDPVHAEPKADPVPHEFIADGAVEGVCSSCGGPRESMLHVAALVRNPNAPHAAEVGDQPEGQPKACLFCTRAVDDPIHAAAIAETIDCSRCGKHVPKAEVLYDSGVKPVCETCKRAGIEAGTWPHPFRKGHAKAHRCADCMQREDDAVHVAAAEPHAYEATVPEGRDVPEEGWPCDLCGRPLKDHAEELLARLTPDTKIPDTRAEETRAVAYTPEEMERQAAGVPAAAERDTASDPAASPDFDPALDDVATPSEGGGAGA